MAKGKSTDVTKTGPIGLKGIRGTDLYNRLEEDASSNEAVASVLNTLSRSRYFPGEVGDIDRYFEPTEETNPEWKKLGKSTYDSPIVFGNDPSVIDEYRADRQSGFVQAFNGIAKGVTTAATTFIDGTAGLIWGLGQGIYNAATDSKDGFFEGLFNNDVSNSMRALNQYMEEVLPNYRTKDEIENPWALRNVSSVNTIADDFLKNLGFTVGAFYSGGAYLSALKGLGTLVRAGRMSETAARTIGSIMNGLSEGRIEAGNLYDEQIKTEMGNLQAAYNEEMARIDAMPDTLVPLEGGGFYSPKQQAKLELAERFKEAQVNVEDRASNAAVADMIGNTLYLGASEFWTFGKLYGSKFAKRAELANRTKTTGKKGLDLVAEDAARTEGAAGRIQRNATGYEVMKRPTKKAVLSGLGVGALEGAEEMNQAFMSSTFGNMYTPDSPDAYYKALTEDEYNIRSKDFMTALKDGFDESWGNSNTYKEGAIGFLTGILGMPTFGRAQNSSTETYLGKGKTVGISGGILGKIAENRALNNQAEQEVSTLNKFVRKVKDTEDFFTRMTAFQDAMDGYSTEKNQFEYQNASDNDMFNGIDAFARTGRLGDLKELVTEDFENLSDERLSDIAHNTESDSNEWRNEDGTYMSDTEDGRQKMRQELAKRRDSILESINEYEQSLADVRYIAGNALDDDQTRELAWLDWKGKQFTKRFNDVRQDVTSFATRLVDTINAFKRGRGRGMLDEDTEEGRNIATQIETFGTLLDFIKEENITPLALGHFLNSNKEVANLLEDDIWETILEDLSGMDSKTYKDNVSRLKDLAKIGQAAVQFNDRFKEFTSNPSALIGNRQKIEETTARTNEARNNANTLSNVNASTIQQLAQGIQEGQVVPDEIRAILDNDGTPSDVADGITQKLDEAERIVNEVDRIERALQAAAADPNIDQQAVADAQAMLERAAQVADNAEQLLDMSSEIYNNADAILSENEVAAAMSAAQSAEEGEAALQELAESRIAGAQTVLTNIERQLRDADERAANLPTSEGARSGEQPGEQQSTGHDSVTTTPPVNRGQQQQESEQQQPQPTAYEQEAAAALEESGILIQPSDRPKVIKDLAHLFFTIDSLVRGNQDVRVIASTLKALPQYQDLAHIIGLDNLNRILNDKVRKSRIAVGLEQVSQQGGNRDSQTPVDPDRLITPEVSDTRVENQIAQEASRPLTSIPSGPINYWKTTLPRLSPYASRGDRRTFIDWAKSSNRFTPQQIKRMEAIYDFLVSRGSFDNVDGGAVSTKVGSRNKPKIKFVSFQSVNREAEETVVFMMDDQGRILGDLGSLNDASTDRQVGLVNFLKNAHQEYQQKIDAGATDDMVELSGETTVLQNMIGKVPYTATTDRRTLNIIWGDKPFTLAVARTSGANSQMIASSRTLSSGQSELEASIMSPLNAVAGQPYVLVETSDPNSGRHFVPVPFNMPPLNTQTAESSLGKVVRSIFDAIPKGDWKAIKMPLMEFLAIQNASVKYSNDGATVQYISVQKQDGTWVKLYDGAANWEGAADKAFRTLLGANIPFQINRKYINGTFMGVSYNRMIGELAETNLPVEGTHTVGDWFTVNPVGQQGSYIQTTGLNPNRNNGQARVVGQEIMYKGVSYTVVPNTWEVFDKDGNRVTGDTTHIVARVQCAYNGYDITKPGPYQTSVGLYNPVEDKFVQEPSTKNISDIQNQKSELQQKAARGILTSVDLDDLLLEAVRNNNREAATALEDILVPIIMDGKYNRGRYTRDDRTRFSQIRGKYIHILQNREPSFKVGDEITGVNYDAEGREVGNWTTKVTKVFDNGAIETEGGVQYSAAAVKKFFGIGKPFTQGAHSLIVHNSRLGDNIPLYNSGEQPAETVGQTQQSQVSNNDILEQMKEVLIQETIKLYNELETPLSAESIANMRSMSYTDNANSGYGREALKDPDIRAKVNAVKTSNTTQQEQDRQQQSQDSNQTDLLDKVQDSLDTDEKKAIWDLLNDTQKQQVADMSSKKRDQFFDEVEEEIFDDGEFNGDVNEYLPGGSRYSRVDERPKSRVWNEKKEKKWLKKALPQLSTGDRLKIHKGLIKISNSKNPELAYGMFRRGIITISNFAASGTLYHEAFHSVMWTLLSENEREDLFDNAQEVYGLSSALALEESMAEDFRRYVQSEERPLIGKLVRAFRWLKHIWQNLRGKEPMLDKVFYSINRGKYANRKPQDSISTRFDINSRERESIKQQAVANGTFMLAPNGKPTNLTEDQWITVRTKNFKDWFGDWENDLANASKVIDENGEPLVVYHYTNNPKFNTFDFSRVGENWKESNGYGRPAMFFLSYLQEEGVRDWGENVMPVFLNIRNPEESSIISIDRLPVINENTDGVIPPAGAGEIRYNEDLRNLRRKYDRDQSYSGDVRSKARREAFSNSLAYIGKEPLRGEFAVFSPSQVKSATDNIGTFDSNNPDIRYRYADDVLALQAEKEFLEKQIDSINEKYNKAIAEIDKRFKDVWFSDGLRRISASSFSSEYSTQQAINRDFADIAHILSVSPEDKGHYAIVFSKKEANIRKYNEIKELRQEVDKINNQLKQLQSNAEESISQAALEDQVAYQDKIEQYYSDKLELGNLTPEQLQYLEQRGITTEEYNRMSQTEREILFRCMV